MEKILIVEKSDIPMEILLEADEKVHIDAYPSDAVYLAAHLEGRIIGCLVLQFKGDQGEILNIAVDEKFRRRRMANGLMEKALEIGRSQDVSRFIVKTGSFSYGPLALYQSVGFRMIDIIPDYFSKHLTDPIIENGYICTDQVVLEYRIYSEVEQKARVKSYWKEFTVLHPEFNGHSYEVWQFGYGNGMGNRLLALVKTGTKCATCSAADVYEEGETLPEVGDLSVVTYGNGLPGCIIRTEEIRTKPYSSITAQEAAMEGEGDLSLKYWQEAHRSFFSMEYDNLGLKFHTDIPVLWERFRVVYNKDG